MRAYLTGQLDDERARPRCRAAVEARQRGPAPAPDRDDDDFGARRRSGVGTADGRASPRLGGGARAR